jgi:hypothetical protein
LKRIRRILYFMHGAECFVQEAAYSILSLWRLPDAEDFEVFVVTDRGARLSELVGAHEKLRILSPGTDLLQSWRGLCAYEHRAKPLAIEWCVRQAAALPGEACLYVDSDTVFTRSPASIFEVIEAGAFVLDEPERKLCDPGTNSHRRLYRACRDLQFVVDGRAAPIKPHSLLWNSGLVGFLVERLDIFDETVRLIDQLYPRAPIHTMEQAALSIVLADRGALLCSGGGSVFHYHMFKEFRAHLAGFFARADLRTPEDRLRCIGDLDPVALSSDKRAFNALPRWRRKMSNFGGRTF